MLSRRLRTLFLFFCVSFLLGCIIGVKTQEALTEKAQTPGEKSLQEFTAEKKAKERKELEEEERDKQPPPAFMNPINASKGECPDGYVFKDRARITDENGRPITKHRVCVPTT